jgi:two-component system chemotaxis response regulator CheB
LTEAGEKQVQALNILIASQECTAVDLLCARISADTSLRLAGLCRNETEVLAAAEAKPDVVALDMRLGGGDGCALITELRGRCGAAIMAMNITVASALQALDAGAIDFVCIPTDGSDSDCQLFAADAMDRIRTASLSGWAAREGGAGRSAQPLRLLVIACSKGGPVPVASLLRRLPKNGPAILVLQRNAGAFADDCIGTLSGMSGHAVIAGLDGVELESGRIYFTDDEQCVCVEKKGGKLTLRLGTMGRRPDGGPVDMLFSSIAEALGEEAACVLLSGSGDGYEGLKCAAAHGALAIVQNKNALLRELGYMAPNGIVELPLEDVADAVLARITVS